MLTLGDHIRHQPMDIDSFLPLWMISVEVHGLSYKETSQMLLQFSKLFKLW